MIRKWAKLLPYWIIIKLVKSFVTNEIDFNGRKAHCWRIDKGEFIVYDEENYRILRDAEKKFEEERISRKKKKIDKILSKDWKLKQELKESFKEEDLKENEE